MNNKSWKNKRKRIFERDGYKCLNPKCPNRKNKNMILTIDHITPLSRGGTDDEDNLQTLCQRCNVWKGNSKKDFRPKQ